MSDQVVSSIIQLVLSLGGAGLLVQLLLLRQNRRKIAGDASSSEANAASTLSGAALAMVENAQRGQHEAEKRADEVEGRMAILRAASEAQWQELNTTRLKIYNLELELQTVRKALVAAGLPLPKTPEEEPSGFTATPHPDGRPDPPGPPDRPVTP